jgi:hypothetical protein
MGMTHEMLATVFELESSLAEHGIQDSLQLHQHATRLVYNLGWKKYGLPPGDAVELAQRTWQRYIQQRD